GEVWLEKITIHTGPEIDLEKALIRDDALGHLIRTVRDVGSTPDVLTSLVDELQELQRKLPAEFSLSGDAFDINKRETLAEAVEYAKQLLFVKLLTQEAGR